MSFSYPSWPDAFYIGGAVRFFPVSNAPPERRNGRGRRCSPFGPGLCPRIRSQPERPAIFVDLLGSVRLDRRAYPGLRLRDIQEGRLPFRASAVISLIVVYVRESTFLVPSTVWPVPPFLPLLPPWPVMALLRRLESRASASYYPMRQN